MVLDTERRRSREQWHVSRGGARAGDRSDASSSGKPNVSQDLRKNNGHGGWSSAAFRIKIWRKSLPNTCQEKSLKQRVIANELQIKIKPQRLVWGRGTGGRAERAEARGYLDIARPNNRYSSLSFCD